MTADDQARLDALTPDVLRSHAAWAVLRADQTRRMIADCASDGAVAVLERIGDHLSDLAILCEAVAGAQEWWESHRLSNQRVTIIAGKITIFKMSDRHGYLTTEGKLGHGLTLAAALGAVSETKDA